MRACEIKRVRPNLYGAPCKKSVLTNTKGLRCLAFLEFQPLEKLLLIKEKKCYPVQKPWPRYEQSLLALFG